MTKIKHQHQQFRS